MDIQQIREFLTSRPALKIHAIEKDLNFPRMSIVRIKDGTTKTLTKKKLVRLADYLEKYGFTKVAQ